MMRLGRATGLATTGALAAALVGLAGEGRAPGDRDRAWGLLEAAYYAMAVEEFERVDRASGGSCAECRVGMAIAFNRTGEFDAAVLHARRALELDASGEDHARAWSELGRGLLGLAGAAENRNEKNKMRRAVRAFRRVIELDGELDGAGFPEARFDLGETLLRLGSASEGRDWLRSFLASGPSGPRATRARLLLERPECLTERCAPPYSLESRDGRRFDWDEMLGRVMLLEFWASWCKPCVEAVPALRHLRAEHSDAPFDLVGISVDASADELEAFLVEHGVDWPQHWDPRGTMTRDVFQVASYPTYLLVDHRGKIRYRATGWSDEIERTLAEETRLAVSGAHAARAAD